MTSSRQSNDLAALARSAMAMVDPGYGSRRIPDQADEVFSHLVDRFSTLDKTQRTAFGISASPLLRAGLAAFGQRTATLAVRTHDASVLLPGLVGALFMAEEDWRDALPVLALVYRSGAMLGVDMERDIFLPARDLVGPRGREVIDGFLERSEDRRWPEVFGWTEGADEDGFLYTPQ
jgi:hypothetical protein